MLWWRIASKNSLFGNWADPNLGMWICFKQLILRPFPKRAFRQPSLLEDTFFRVAISQQKRSRICVSEPLFEQQFAPGFFVQNSLCNYVVNISFLNKCFLYPVLPPEVVEVSRGGCVHHGDDGVALALVEDPPGVNLISGKGNYLCFVSFLWNWN